jgi:hypothetical protein
MVFGGSHSTPAPYRIISQRYAYMSAIASAERAAVVIASPKVAALYYDRIYPLPGRPEHVEETAELLSQPDRKIATLLTEPPSEYREFFHEVVSMLQQLSPSELQDKLATTQSSGPCLSDPVEQAMYYASCQCNLAASMELVLSEVLSPPKTSKKKRGIANDFPVLVHMTNLNIVDPSSCSWDQILEFRKDPEARAAFIRLRDFLFTSCEDMPVSRLGDRVASLLNEYEEKRKQHGFEVQAAAWDVVLNSQNFLRALCAGALGVTVTQLGATASTPVLATSLTGLAIVFDVARATIVRKRKLIEGEVFLSRHPLHWAFLARRELSEPSTFSGIDRQEGLFSRFRSLFK